jgi:hypothetical protein
MEHSFLEGEMSYFGAKRNVQFRTLLKRTFMKRLGLL